MIKNLLIWFRDIVNNWYPEPESEPEPEPETESSRQIFEYWDGQYDCRIDPYRVWRGLWHDPNVNFAEDMAVLATPIHSQPDVPADSVKMQYEAREESRDRIVGLVCRVFQVNEFDDCEGTGLTVGEIFELLERFHEFNKNLKKKPEISQIASPSTVSESSPAS